LSIEGRNGQVVGAQKTKQGDGGKDESVHGPLKILYASAEVAPFAKVGGLADVAGALPKALKALRHDIRVVMPGYAMVEKDPRYAVKRVIDRMAVPLGGGVVRQGYVSETRIGKDLPVYLIGSRDFYRDAVESGKIYGQGCDAYIYFARAIFELIRNLHPSWRPDIIHGNDWHMGFIPVYLAAHEKVAAEFGDVASAFTVHNLSYQGEFDYDVLARADLAGSLFAFDKMEAYGRVNFLKSGVVFADVVNTVSETYAKEIQTAEYGAGLEGLLEYVDGQGRLYGIVNGIDYDVFNPATDPNLAANYDAADPRGKAKCKVALQREFKLPADARAPLIGVVSRLADQKGLDLIKKIMGRLVKENMQFVLLGTGDPRYERYFTKLSAQLPTRIAARIGFDVKLAQRIYAGADLFLMPSRFEPCGLGQMIALRYGTVPIVRKTGGLADTVRDFSPRTGKGNGFVFGPYKPDRLIAAMRKAIATFRDQEAWRTLVGNAMSGDYSWRNSAVGYVSMYCDALGRSQARAA
jgi:starch synthase